MPESVDPLVHQLACMHGLGGCAGEDLQRVATATARAFGAAIGLIWIEDGPVSAFRLHMEDAVPQGSPLRVPARWQRVRAAIGDLPVHIPDVSEHPAFSFSPLLPGGGAATLIGVPLRRGGSIAGAVAVVQPHVVGHLDHALLDALDFWAHRLSGDLALAHLPQPPRPPPALLHPLSQADALESIAAALDTALLASDERGFVCYASPAMLALLGTERRHVLGQARAFVLGRLAAATRVTREAVLAVVDAGAPAELVLEGPGPRSLRWRARPLALPGRPAGTLDEIVDVTAELGVARARETLVRLDAPTGLPNRAAVDDALAREVARSLRGGESFSIALFAVDAASDERFCRAASLLRSTARRDDLVARVDRLRLAAILSGAREEQALAFCRRFAGELRRVEAEGARSVVSAGVAAYDAGKTPRDVLGEAAAHLAEATRRGGNCAVAPR